MCGGVFMRWMQGITAVLAVAVQEDLLIVIT